jgi:hypothetical protein
MSSVRITRYCASSFLIQRSSSVVLYGFGTTGASTYGASVAAAFAMPGVRITLISGRCLRAGTFQGVTMEAHRFSESVFCRERGTTDPPPPPPAPEQCCSPRAARSPPFAYDWTRVLRCENSLAHLRCIAAGNAIGPVRSRELPHLANWSGRASQEGGRSGDGGLASMYPASD